MVRELLNRNLLVLFGCQVFFVSGTVVLVTIGGIVGYELAPSPSLATLPVALMVVGTALMTVPAALIMQKLGRKGGFFVGIALACVGALLAQHAVAQQLYWLFAVAAAFIGSSLAFSQHFRFAAAESVATPMVSHAISFILVGSIVGAFIAPALISHAAALTPATPYVKVFWMNLALYGAAAFLMLFLRNISVEEGDSTYEGRPFMDVVSQPLFITAVVAGIVGQGTMTYVMTATPLSMNVGEGYSIVETAEIIRAHVVAMYLPALFTPFLITRFGLPKMMVAGTVTMFGTLLIGLSGQHIFHYWWSMVLLGVGWNFLFVSGTTMLTQTYRPTERFKAQALNDFGVFTASALASLLAGTILHNFGWVTLLMSAFPALLLMLFMLGWQRTRRMRAVNS